MVCHVRWHGAKYFIVNLIHIHKFYQYELDAQQPHQVCVINILNFFYLNINYLVLICYLI